MKASCGKHLAFEAAHDTHELGLVAFVGRPIGNRELCYGVYTHEASPSAIK
jgi:hypothetical protein